MRSFQFSQAQPPHPVGSDAHYAEYGFQVLGGAGDDWTALYAQLNIISPVPEGVEGRRPVVWNDPTQAILANLRNCFFVDQLRDVLDAQAPADPWEPEVTGLQLPRHPVVPYISARTD